jgi:hypothetical protein
VVVDGRRLETLRIQGRNEGAPTIVMLHEGLGSRCGKTFRSGWPSTPAAEWWFIRATGTEARIG